MKSPTFRLIAAPFTPFSPDGSLNLGVIPSYANFLSEQGVSGVFICGTTGEGMSLTREERKQVAEAWKEALAGRLELIVHVGHTCLAESRNLAAHADDLGVDGIATIGPVFFAPSSPEAWVETCRQIASTAPETAFYYYHMPGMSRIGLTASSLLEPLAAAVPTFRGIKFTHEDMEDYRQCRALAKDGREIFFGRDEKLLEGLKLGATSAVGSTYNFAARLSLETAALFAAGQLEAAADNQAYCTKAIDIMLAHGGLPGIRAALAFAGIDCGPMRLPLQAVPDSVAKAMKKELDAIGYFERI